MIDIYRYDQEGVTSVLIALKNINDKYKEQIDKLNNLIISIDSSSAWKDLKVKTAFINTCNSYIKIYNDLSSKMDIHIEYLQKKANIANDIENKYLGGGV